MAGPATWIGICQGLEQVSGSHAPAWEQVPTLQRRRPRAIPLAPRYRMGGRYSSGVSGMASPSRCSGGAPSYPTGCCRSPRCGVWWKAHSRRTGDGRSVSRSIIRAAVTNLKRAMDLPMADDGGRGQPMAMSLGLPHDAGASGLAPTLERGSQKPALAHTIAHKS